jgi:hypothetical protein
MNIVAFVIGIFVSIIVILRFRQTRLESRWFTYSLLLFTFPFYYLIFAVYGNDYAALPLEFFGGLPFFIIALLALKFDAFYKFSLLAIGYILHGLYDVTHHLFFINTGTPVWWPEFCGVIDIIVGLYLLNLAFKSRAIDAKQVNK